MGGMQCDRRRYHDDNAKLKMRREASEETKGGESGMKRAWVSGRFQPRVRDIPDVENNAGNPRQCALQRHFIDDDDDDNDDEDFLAMLTLVSLLSFGFSELVPFTADAFAKFLSLSRHKRLTSLLKEMQRIFYYQNINVYFARKNHVIY